MAHVILATMRIVFMGSPEFALPTLRRLIASAHEIVGVYTQPDRPTGRGRRLAPPPVKALALEHALPVFQPASISKPESVARFRELAPDIAIVAAYGQILKQAVLDVPPLGILNVHASLLPRWRGAAPIPAAILAGDAVTGATIMKIVRALDAGPMLARVEEPILPVDTTATLTPRIAETGATLLMDALPGWAAGTIVAEEQDDAAATYAPQVKKEDALLDFATDSAETLARRVRAYNPWPMAYAYLDGSPLRIVEAVVLQAEPYVSPQTIFATEGAAALAVATADGALGLVRVQPAGGKVMAGADYLRGHAGIAGKHLTRR
jgi:methionyl-tRNA formyltransferase